MVKVTAQYNVAKAGSLPVRLAAYQRKRIFDVLLDRCSLPDLDATILDVGVTRDRTYEASNYLEAWYPHKKQITAVGIDDCSFLMSLYPGLTFIRADARALPFKSQSFDVVHSSATIEHVGSFESQVQMIAECSRVARRFIFITTPNRWFPVEFHTVLPFVHWLPKAQFRRLMRATGMEFFAEESNLNLVTSNELLRATVVAKLFEFEFTVETVKIASWPSNLLLIGKRKTFSQTATP